MIGLHRGSFWMGCLEGKDCNCYEQPSRQVSLPAFSISQEWGSKQGNARRSGVKERHNGLGAPAELKVSVLIDSGSIEVDLSDGRFYPTFYTWLVAMAIRCSG